ncbi:MAG: ABC transporter substrate-binding protein [Xanthobacteraceae bacterium]|nr:ABC transporter substrate-binding protein [Xanthobacteraceae bacterium]
MWHFRIAAAALAAAVSVCAERAVAQDSFKLAMGQKDNWENQAPALGQRMGFFKAKGLTLDILGTQGGGETLQAVISGSVDIGIGVGTIGAMGAFSKGAPIRIISASVTGAGDVYWYVLSSSPVQSLADAKGKTIAFSTVGASTQNMVAGFIKHFKLDGAKAVATGGPAATFTQVISGQIDIGWASPPFALNAVEEGRIRIVGRGSDAPSTADQTVRVHIVNLNTLRKRRDAVTRFMQAYRESLDWMYSGPQAAKLYAETLKIPESRALRVRDEFYPKDALSPDRMTGLESQMADGVVARFLQQPLTKDQLAELIQILK